jgi:hypothetical protein
MPTAPGAGFKRHAEDTFISPDKKVRVEQYSKDLKDWRALYQFWTFDRDRRHGFLLNPGEDDDVAGYAAGFRFSPDSQWLVRMQKLGAGYQTLFLYRRNGYQFSPATTKPLGDLAWDFFLPYTGIKGDASKPKGPVFAPTGAFSVPPDFADHNAKAVEYLSLDELHRRASRLPPQQKLIICSHQQAAS